MEIVQIDNNIAEIIADRVVIATAEDGVDILGSLFFNGFDKVIIHQKNLTPDFFDLKTGLAGEILQKFSTYRVRLIVIGDYSGYTSQSLKDFIYESNKGRHVNFVSTKEDAIARFSV